MKKILTSILGILAIFSATQSMAQEYRLTTDNLPNGKIVVTFDLLVDPDLTQTYTSDQYFSHFKNLTEFTRSTEKGFPEVLSKQVALLVDPDTEYSVQIIESVPTTFNLPFPYLVGRGTITRNQNPKDIRHVVDPRSRGLKKYPAKQVEMEEKFFIRNVSGFNFRFNVTEFDTELNTVKVFKHLKFEIIPKQNGVKSSKAATPDRSVARELHQALPHLFINYQNNAVASTYNTSVGVADAATPTADSYFANLNIGSGKGHHLRADNAIVFGSAKDGVAYTSKSAFATVTVTRGGTTTEKILNGGFESGVTYWTARSGVIGTFSGQPAYEGTKNAWMCGYGFSHTDTLYQQVSIPSTATSAILSFYLHIDTKETTTTSAYDKLTVTIQNSSGSVLRTLGTFSNLNKNTGYAKQTFDVSAYKGQTIRVHFQAAEDSILSTSFVVDKISLTVTDSTNPPNTNITYNTSVVIADAATPTAGLSFADLDKDGNLDIVLGKGRHWPANNEVVFGNGRGGILRRLTLPGVADQSYGAQVGDLDLDGDLDIVIGSDTPSPKQMYRNNGSGGFSLMGTYGSTSWPERYCTLVDMNGDGARDIVASNRWTGGNFVCYNTIVNGSFGNFPMSNCRAFSSEPATGVAVGDFNKDGVPDIAVPNRDGGQSYLYWGPNFNTSSRVPWGPRNATFRLGMAADYDGDGLLDIAVIAEETGGVRIYYGKGNGQFQEVILTGVPQAVPYAMTVGDLNGDGRPDIVVGYVGAQPAAFFRQAPGSASAWKIVRFGDESGTVYGLAIGDFNKDGLPDIGVGRDSADSRVYFATSN